MKVNSGFDYQARVMGGDSNVGVTGTATATTATSLTNTGATFPTVGTGPNQGYTGHIVQAGTVYGVIISNTATVLTIDHWHTVATPDTVAATPAATVYVILPGQAPAWYIGLSTNATAPAVTHTFLDNGAAAISELWATSGGLDRAQATYAHTAATGGAGTYTLTKIYTANANDGASNTIQKVGVFCHNVVAAPTTTTSGTMLFSTAVTSPPTLVSGDQLTITETITL